MKQIFALTTIIVLLAVVIPAPAAPPDDKQCEIWLWILKKIPPKSPNHQRTLNNLNPYLEYYPKKYWL